MRENQKQYFGIAIFMLILSISALIQCVILAPAFVPITILSVSTLFFLAIAAHYRPKHDKNHNLSKK